MSKNRNRNLIRSNQCFHLLFRHFNRFHFFCHFLRHRNFYFFRCLHQKLYASVQRAYHFSRRLKHQRNRYFEQKLFHDQSLHRSFFVFRLRHSNRCANSRKMQTLFVRLFRFERLHHRNFIWSWTICFACSLRNRIHLICNDIKCVRFFWKTLTNAIVTTISKANVISYKVALRHIFMRQFHLFSNRSNSKHLSQHMFANSFRVNFRSRHVRFHLFFFSRFASMRFHFSTVFRSFFVCKHCQRRFVIYRFIDWVVSNVSKVENNEIFMKQRYWSFVSFHFVLKEYWFFFEKVTTLRKLEHVVCLFVLFVRFFS